MAAGLVLSLSLSMIFVAIYPPLMVRLAALAFAGRILQDTAPGGHMPDSSGLAHGVPNLFYALGGNGPWIPKRNGTVEGGNEPPDGCRVTQMHMLSRHAERFPTALAGSRMWALYQRLQAANVTLSGDMAFATDWDFFMDDPNADVENLVSTGPYAGTLEAFTTGVKLRTRYSALLDQAQEKGFTRFWASDSNRVIDTAKYFAAGFFGIDSPMVELEVIPETQDRGADTLTPGRTCLNYRNDVDPNGHAYGYRMMDAFRETYEPAIVARLAEQNPQMPFAEDEVLTMQLICGFETIAKGGSPWCDVFTTEEWASFAYARDVIHYYRSGPGNPYGATMGWLWLNATADLLREGPDAGPLFLSFVHDGDIIPFLAALDLFPQEPHLPTTHIPHDRAFRTSDVVPMGGRVILERLVCPGPTDCWSNAPFYPNHVYCAPPEDEVFVRVDVNDGIVAIPGCDSGPGRSCPFDGFLERTRRAGEEAGGFGERCGLAGDAPGRITFVHQQPRLP